MTIRRNLLIVVIAASAVVCAGEPLGFKGDLLGMTLREFQERYQREVKGSVAPHLDYDEEYRDTITARKTFPFEGQSKETIAGVQVDLPVAYIFFAKDESDWLAVTSPHREWSKSLSQHTDQMVEAARKGQRPKSFAPPKQRDWTAGERKAMESLRLGAIDIYFPSDRYHTVVEGLREKYGPPGSILAVEMQNRFGAKFSSMVSLWTISDTETIEARELDGKLDRARVRFSNSSIAADPQRSSARAREAAKDL